MFSIFPYSDPCIASVTVYGLEGGPLAPMQNSDLNPLPRLWPPGIGPFSLAAPLSSGPLHQTLASKPPPLYPTLSDSGLLSPRFRLWVPQPFGFTLSVSGPLIEDQGIHDPGKISLFAQTLGVTDPGKLYAGCPSDNPVATKPPLPATPGPPV